MLTGTDSIEDLQAIRSGGAKSCSAFVEIDSLLRPIYGHAEQGCPPPHHLPKRNHWIAGPGPVYDRTGSSNTSAISRVVFDW